MRVTTSYLEGLIDLPAYAERASRRTVFRQSIASLALALTVDGPAPLDGLSPEALQRSVRVALADGLLDDLSWLAPSAAAVAIYELAGALPLGEARRELGRRALSMLYEGNATTFVTVATRMAAQGARALGGASVRARVALALSLPASSDVPTGPLALAIASRREVCRDWIAVGATGSLPERRMAARLVEHAAREAVRRASQGDDHALRLFRGLASPSQLASAAGGRLGASGNDMLADASAILLADRETLVWRHVAAARGLLAGVVPEIREQIRRSLAPHLSATEWRRAATSLVACVAVDPEGALTEAFALLASPLVAKDPGIATAMVWGIARAADTEPEAAERLLAAIARAAPIPTAESIADLRLDVEDFGAEAAGIAARALAASVSQPQRDDGLAALARCILSDLTEGIEGRVELRAAIHDALIAFSESGSREAHGRAQAALAAATETVTALEALEGDDAPGARGSLARRAAVRLLRELDVSLLEASYLKNLLLLDRRVSDGVSGVAALDDLDDRIARWLLRNEAPSGAGTSVPHLTLHQRQLRALLHLIDAETTDFGEDHERRARVRERWTAATSLLLTRLVAERNSPLRRAIAATLARALDALVRDGAADASDILLYAARRLGDPADLEVLAEASMHPDTSELLRLFAAFAQKDGDPEPDARPSLVAELRLAALKSFTAELPPGASQRTEVLRATLARMVRALEAVHSARALRPLVPDATHGEATPLSALEESVASLAQLTAGARRRCGDDDDDGAASARPHTGGLALVAGRVASREAPSGRGEPSPHPELEEATGALVRTARAAIPPAIADVLGLVLPRLALLPVDRPSLPDAMPTRDPPLPAWLPSRRTIGGFYVHRQLGGGAVGTVFAVTRAEERHDPAAERFALKVPDYDATAARSVSESEFLKLFREEAGALLAVPEHRNVARFVTFDAGAKPKPILVMELVEGTRVDQALAARALSTPGAFALLDGVLAGLESMHGVGVGHLDLKPTNVILRGGIEGEPVLVDFGLSGRHIRPGCATTCYGAPEVWGVYPEGATPTPMTVDVYSFGCLAYEVLTARTLFDAPTEVALVSAHLTHDGLPPAVKALAQNPRTRPLAMLLFSCLRQHPAGRARVPALRSELRKVAAELSHLPWPLAPEPRPAREARP